MSSLNEIIKSYNKASTQKRSSSQQLIQEKKETRDPFGSFVKCMAQVIATEQTKAQEQEYLQKLNEKKEIESTKKHLNSFFSALAETLKEEATKQQPKEKEEEEEPKEQEDSNLNTAEQNKPSESEQTETRPEELSSDPVVSTNDYVGELSKASKTIPLSKEAEEENKLKGLVSKQLTEEVNKIRQLFPNFGMSGSGGGTNAVQYANGGTMNGDLNVTGRYLSGGIDLLQIFSGTGIGVSSSDDGVVDGGFYT